LACEPTPRTDRSCPDDERHIHDRTKHYKVVQALTDLTLDVPSGIVFGFLGANGAGKTSAMKLRNRQYRPRAVRGSLERERIRARRSAALDTGASWPQAHKGRTS
jgi:ABC-2 type transport system ATP-binding protein